MKAILLLILVTYVVARPNGGSSSAGSTSSQPPPPPKHHHKGHKGVKKVHDRNIDRAGNVVATLQHTNGTANLNQKDNNEADHDMDDNNITKGYATLNAEAKADNVVAGLQNAYGKNTVNQGKNDNNDTNDVKNTIAAQNANSQIYFAAANTVGKAISVSSGTNMVEQVSNNDAAKNSFENI